MIFVWLFIIILRINERKVVFLLASSGYWFISKAGTTLKIASIRGVLSYCYYCAIKAIGKYSINFVSFVARNLSVIYWPGHNDSCQVYHSTIYGLYVVVANEPAGESTIIIEWSPISMAK